MPYPQIHKKNALVQTKTGVASDVKAFYVSVYFYANPSSTTVDHQNDLTSN